MVVNLYPFEKTVAAGKSRSEVVEMIDVGGPAMIRAAAKNHARVAVVVDPADYAAVLEEIRMTGGTKLSTRERLAARAFSRTAAYDAVDRGLLRELRPRAVSPFRRASSSPSTGSARSATARTRTSGRRSMPFPRRRPTPSCASRCSRARSSRSTTSSISTPP